MKFQNKRVNDYGNEEIDPAEDEAIQKMSELSLAAESNASHTKSKPLSAYPGGREK